MLLRNIDPKAGLCNGTRLLCRGFFMNMLDVEILTGHNAGKRYFFPRIKHKTTESAGLPFVLIRKQFPVKLSFAITINKSQGQTIPNVGIYLPRHVFGHGQLYVALSRGVSQASTKILIKEGKLEGEDGNFTKNIVFKEILLSQNQVLPLLIYNYDGFRLILDTDIQKLKFVSFIFLSTVKLRCKEILQLYEEINRKNLNMYFDKHVSDNIFIYFFL
uniref:ATP-dependent DNA helicase PIF1 n=1 Tax=Cajanus cajan TaxID=3821 RepID=A0A151QLC0_CAJCA|nr:ATP-dependent DNA helicase PIF1 [Cajanus cajan]